MPKKQSSLVKLKPSSSFVDPKFRDVDQTSLAYELYREYTMADEDEDDYDITLSSVDPSSFYQYSSSIWSLKRSTQLRHFNYVEAHREPNQSFGCAYLNSIGISPYRMPLLTLLNTKEEWLEFTKFLEDSGRTSLIGSTAFDISWKALTELFEQMYFVRPMMFVEE